MSDMGRTAVVSSEPAGQAPRADARIGSNVRKAALLLHAMPERDRTWLLDKLPETERTALRSLLKELKALGIPADGELLNEVLSAREASSSPVAPAVSGADPGQPAADADASVANVRALARAAPARVAAILRGEPPGLIAHVLSLHPWPWRQDLLQRLGPVKLRQVEDSMTRRAAAGRPGSAAGSDVAAAPALRDRLLAVLCQRISDPKPSRGDEQVRCSHRRPFLTHGMLRAKGRSWLGANLDRLLRMRGRP